MTIEMTPEYWQAARAIANTLSTAKTDVNELKKVVAYLCWLRNCRGRVEKEHLFTYLETLAQHGEIRSNQTPQYYQTIQQACCTYLEPLQTEGNALIQILGWAARLQKT